MAGNSFGEIFRVTTFGESHGKGIGVVIDGCPARLQLDMSFIQSELRRRRPGQSALTTQRQETEEFEILSGVLGEQTTGAPLTIWIANRDARPADYTHVATTYRPSHADYTYEAKYGIRDVRGSGRASARETAARVAAGAVAKVMLRSMGIEIGGYVRQVGTVAMTGADRQWPLAEVEASLVRCPDPATSASMQAEIERVRDLGDSLGGVIACVITGVPAGLGEPVFDRLHADLGKGILSINACKGFEIGSGFAGAAMQGSAHNDPFVQTDEGVRTTTNHSGGVQGGISNGMEIIVRAAFKPVSTLMQTQRTIDQSGQEVELEGKGRHDPCVVPRAVPIVEAMCALVLADHLLRHRARADFISR
ncbi:MAG: chorismate synthase [Saprospiraceae bacterium]|nr:chorismate synthase [Saprospiraceae bacterium]